MEMVMPSSFAMLQCVQEYRISRQTYYTRIAMGKSHGVKAQDKYVFKIQILICNQKGQEHSGPHSSSKEW